eukprot:jgi/Hompol1/2470/HPOL_000089-RA
MRQNIFDIWRRFFERVFPSVKPLIAIEYRKKFLDHFIVLIKTGFVTPIFVYLQQRIGKVDHSVIVYFLSTVITLPSFAAVSLTSPLLSTTYSL